MSVDRINKDLDDLMWRAVQLDAMDMREIRAVWDAEDEEVRRAAWQRVKDALKRTGREQLMDETRERVRLWMNDVPVLRGAYHMLGLPKMDDDLSGAKAAVAAAVLDAAAAAIVGEFLSGEELQVLRNPFLGEPES
jgi:hypothetical protein